MIEAMPDAKSSGALPIRVLIVDNDPPLADSMAESLERVGYPCAVATSGPEGAKLVEQDTFDVIITDLVMNDVDGMQLLNLSRRCVPDAQVIMITGHASIPRAVEAMQQGAFIFLEKPITPDRLRAVVERAADSVRLRRDNLELNKRLDERFGYEGIVFTSDRMKQVMDRVRRIAPTDATVLITGDSGTGKELIAQAIHQNSPRKGKRLFPINCAAVAENLVESELFGHVKGSFTDARTDRVGAFECANGGTLFLDEVGDMRRSTQTKLLRVLEENCITRVGDNKPIEVNVRVLSATNCSLEDAIAKGQFREDLYYRLKVVTVELPSLAERPEDIVPLMEHFRRVFAKHHRKNVERFSPEVRTRFFTFHWPGNVRQLRNAVETMVVLDIDGTLDVDDLPPELADSSPPAPLTSGGLDHLIGQPLEAYEKYAIAETLKLTNGNREEAARILCIGARTLYRKLEKYELS
jgi:two-component system response regulator HydG